MKRLPWKNIHFLIVLTLLGVIGMQYCIGLRPGSLGYTNSIWTFLLWVVLLYHLRKMARGDMWEKIVPLLTPCFIFGLCFVGAMSAGTQLDAVGAIDFADGWSYGAVLMVAVMLAPFSGGYWLSCLTLAGRMREITGRQEERELSY